MQSLAWRSVFAPEPRRAGIDLLGDLGFQGIREISGGGALVTEPFEVYDENAGVSYRVIPFDAVANREFGDFIYVVTDIGSTKILEISSQSIQLDIPTVEETLEAAHVVFGQGKSVAIDARLCWRSRRGAVSRLDVYRKIEVDGTSFHVLRDRTIAKEFPNFEIGG
jgi:hypothetical protein